MWYFVKTEAVVIKGINALLDMGYEVSGIVCAEGAAC